MRRIIFLTIAIMSILGVAPIGVAAQETSAAHTVHLPLVVVPGPASSPNETSFEQQVLELINQQRIQAGCPAFTLDPALHSAAQTHSQDMAANDFFSHTGSDGSRAGERIERAGYHWRSVAENISAGRATAEQTVAGWMASDGHRDNILDCSLTETGVGYVFANPDGGSVTWQHYWTQVFGSRAPGSSSSTETTEESPEAK